MPLTKLKITSLFSIVLILSSFASAQAPPKTKEVFAKLGSLNSMREALAQSIPAKSNITPGTFQSVCLPVGREFKQWAQSIDHSAHQISHKNRNPAHKVPAPMQAYYDQFLADPKLNELSFSEVLRNEKGDNTRTHYLYRIPVATACLQCHGEKSARPTFVIEKYPEDRAYGFKSGELRGVYWLHSN